MTKIEISLKTLLIVAALILLYQFLANIISIIVLVLIAYIIAAAIDPLILILKEKGIPRTLSITLIYLALFIFAFLFIWGIVFPLFRELISLFRQLPVSVDQFIKANPFLSGFGIVDIKQVSKNATMSLISANTGISTIYRTALGTVRAFVDILSVIVMSIYMLFDKERNTKALANVVPTKYRERVLSIILKVENKLGEWVRAQFLLSFIVFLLNYLFLSIIGIKFALTLSLIAGFLEVIPVAGPIVSGTTSTLVTLIISPSKAIFVFVLSTLIQQFEAHVLVPKTMQKVVGLSPVITIIALLVGAQLLGLAGAVLSVPTAAILQILYLEAT